MKIERAGGGGGATRYARKREMVRAKDNDAGWDYKEM